MNLHDYIEKLRARPVRERERIAVIVTIIGFFIFVGIWVVSFNEMNKSVESAAEQIPANFDDLKTDFQEGRDSIQDMIQDLPASPPTPPDRGETGGPSAAQGNMSAQDAMDEQAESALPQLP